MLQPAEIRYTLIVRGLKSYVLINAPVDWEKMIITQSRSETYFGIVRALTDPLEFVTQGALILRTEFYKYGIKADVQLQIEVLQNDWSYVTVYVGALDFSNITDGLTSFTTNGYDSDISAKIKAYGDASYEIPVNVSEAVTIQLTPIKLIESATFIFTPNTVSASGNYFPGLQIVINEHKATVTSSQPVSETPQDNPVLATSDKWFFRASSDTKVNINGYLRALIGAYNSSEVQDISIYNQNFQKVYNIYNTAVNPKKLNTLFNFSVDLTVNKNDRLFFYLDSNQRTNKAVLQVIEGELNLSYFTVSDPTPCKLLTGKYLFDQLLQNINDGVKVPSKSFLLENTWKQLLFTSGDSVRQLTTKQITNPDGSITTLNASPVIKTTLNDFFKSVNAITNCGLGIEKGTVVLEGKNYFYRQTTKAASFNSVKWTTGLTVNQALLYNTIKGGYPDQTYDELNGRDEFNSEVNWVTPCAATDGQSKELDIQSAYRADSYGIEFTRINLSGKSSIDNSSDNDTFMVYANAGLTQPESSEALQYYAGIAAGSTVYNWRISPKRNLLRHGSYLRSCFYKLENYRIRLGKALKNKDLATTDLAGLSVKESTDILIGNLDAALFLPYQIGLTAFIGRDGLDFIDKNPYGFIDFGFNGSIYKSFIGEFKFDISKNSSQEFTGMLCADNNLNNLVR